MVHFLYYYHAYPVFFLFHGITVCIPHLLWTATGEHSIRRMLKVLDVSGSVDKYSETFFQRKQAVVSELLEGLGSFEGNGLWFFFVQILNCFILFFNVFLIDSYMKTEFFGVHMLGIMRYDGRPKITLSLSDILFPRLSKCSITKISISGDMGNPLKFSFNYKKFQDENRIYFVTIDAFDHLCYLPQSKMYAVFYTLIW